MAERPVAEITGDLHSLYFEGMEKTHPKILNPHSFPLPRPGHLILSGNVYKEVRRVVPLPCEQVLVSRAAPAGPPKQVHQTAFRAARGFC
jgi:hypothetical protein